MFNYCIIMMIIIGMFGMRKFRYRYTGKNIPVIPVYQYFGLVKIFRIMKWTKNPKTLNCRYWLIQSRY